MPTAPISPARTACGRLVPSAAHAAPAASAAATSATAVSDVLLPGQYLKPGQYRRSKNNLYTLVMQTDGNAVLIKGRTPIWASMTNRKAPTLIMQDDGNLVVVYGRTPIWSSNTSGR